MVQNSSRIEKLAINRIMSLFLSCGKVQPWLSQGDKEPLWDGFLYLYSSAEWTNRDMKGRVACQIKGRDSNLESTADAYSVNICDLENYLRDGGVLFFVVHVNADCPPVYWARLAPVDIRGYLTRSHGRQSISIKLERMPTARDECERMVFEFYKHCQLQRNSPIDGSMIAQKGKFKTSFHVEPGELPLLVLTKGYHYLYYSDEQGEFGAPVGDTRYAFQIGTQIADSIIIAGEEIKVSVVLKMKEGRVFLSFDKFMTLDLERDDGTSCLLNYNADELLGVRERNAALSVLLAMDATDEFSVDGHSYSCAEVSISAETRKSIEEELEVIRKVVGFLDCLHVRDDLSLGVLSDQEFCRLNTLYHAILDKRIINSISAENDYQVDDVTIGPISVKVWIVKDGDAYRVYDFFATDYVISIAADESGQKHEVSRFVLLNKQDYIKTSNIDWTLIPSDYARIYKGDVELLHVANKDVMNMLLAYDDCGKKEILDAALRLADWMVGVSQDKEERAIYKVNYFQAIKRQRSLTKQECQELISISDASYAGCELKYCCALLLDDFTRANYYFDSMTPDNQSAYLAFPIHYFYIKLKKSQSTA